MAQTAEQLSDAELRLLLAPGIGPHTHRKLIDVFRSAEDVVAAGESALKELPGIGRDTARAIRRAIEASEPDRERALLQEHDARIVQRGDAEYPELLGLIPDPPSALWMRGELKRKERLAIAIVGSRRCTAYGREQASRFASLLSQSGMTIVSGGAKGVDAEAHRGALRVHGRTIVVLGCGLARLYPTEHEKLFERVAEEGGAVVTEYPMEVGPHAENFPRRNRIVSGMALGVVVIEAAKRSGALITARLAAEEHGREVMALPGRVDSPASAGCLELLRSGGAALVRDHTDVLTQLDGADQLVRGAIEMAASADGAGGGTVDAEADASRPTTLFDANLTDDQRAMVGALSDSEDRILPLEQLAARTQIPMSRLMADLTVLQIRGRVQRDHRGVRLVDRTPSGKG